MEFSDSTVEACWKIVRGRCECTRTTHGHGYRCDNQPVWEDRGKTGRSGWRPYKKGGSPNNDSLDNCEIICGDCQPRPSDIYSE